MQTRSFRTALAIATALSLSACATTGTGGTSFGIGSTISDEGLARKAATFYDVDPTAVQVTERQSSGPGGMNGIFFKATVTTGARSQTHYCYMSGGGVFDLGMSGPAICRDQPITSAQR